MQLTKPLLFAIIASALLIYTYFCVDPHHIFIINGGWDTNMIDAKLLFYSMTGLGFCLALFYAFFSNVLYSNQMIIIHALLYFALVVIIVLWDNNTFSLQQVVDSEDFNSLREIKGEYSNILDKNHAYRVVFWILLSTQMIGLFNLILGFFKSNKD